MKERVLQKKVLLFGMLLAVFMLLAGRMNVTSANTLEFNMNGYGEQIPAKELKEGTVMTTPSGILPVPVADGATFRGWSLYPDRDEWVETQKLTASKLTVYGRWDVSDMTISFDGNGGIGGMAPLVVKYGTTVNLPSNVFNRSGYTFVNWNTNPNGGGTVYQNNQQVSYNTGLAKGAVEHKSITLYAQWNRRYAPVIMATAVPVGKKKVNVSWTPVEGAAYYVIYRTPLSANSAKAAVAVPVAGGIPVAGGTAVTGSTAVASTAIAYPYGSAAAASATSVAAAKTGATVEVRREPAGVYSVNIGGHQKNFSYKYRVDAFGSNNMLICQSPEIYCFTGTMTGKAAAKKVIVDQPGIAMNAGSFRMLTVQVKTKKNLPQPGFVSAIRYYSNNPGVATVGSNGQIVGIAKGDAVIYCVAENGVFSTCNVTVN